VIELDVPDALIVPGDDDRLRQVMANLLSNALTHTPAGTPVAVRVSESDAWAEVQVSDRGPGLAADEAAQVFEPFYRADPARGRDHDADDTDEGKGTGLGLAIVAAIAEAHGGRAEVVSEPGDGATFIVRLPIGGEGTAPSEDADVPDGVV